MMALATLTTKGQVTIPKEVRDVLHLQSGDKIEFFIKESGETIIRPICKKVDDVFCKLKRTHKKPVSTEEMDQAIKNKLKSKFL